MSDTQRRTDILVAVLIWSLVALAAYWILIAVAQGKGLAFNVPTHYTNGKPIAKVDFCYTRVTDASTGGFVTDGSDWLDIAPGQRRTNRWDHLAPGSYKLEIYAVSLGVVGNTNTVTLTAEVLLEIPEAPDTLEVVE